MYVLIILAGALIILGLIAPKSKKNSQIYPITLCVVGVIMLLVSTYGLAIKPPPARISLPEGYEAIKKGDTLFMYEKNNVTYIDYYRSGSPNNYKLFIVK